MGNTRKIIFILILTILLFTLSACKGDKYDGEYVRISIPCEFVADDVEIDSLEEGILGAEKKEDGSIDIDMTEEKHNEIITRMKNELTTTLDAIPLSEEVSYIKGIDYNEDFTHIKVFVDHEDMVKSIDFTPFAIGLSVSMYQIYNGEDRSAEIHYIDEKTNLLVDITKYPEDFID